MEQDDLASLIRYMLYTNEFDTQAIIYTSSRFHWAGDGKNTTFFLPGREYTTPQTSFRWTGTRTIQDIVIPAYAQVYPNLRVHDPSYPTPQDLQSLVHIGNIDFEGEMDHDTDGSNTIKTLLLDWVPRPLYLQAWGGVSTIARALKSIELQYLNTPQWARIKAAVSTKAVIMASGFQDDTYDTYVAPNWPAIRVENFQAGYSTWAYNCNRGQGNTRGAAEGALEYFSGPWIHANIEIGPYGKLYRSWLDGQHMPGDREDGFGNATLAAEVDSWCPAQKAYDFLSEGDNVVYNPLIPTGIQVPSNPLLSSWGGRAIQNSSSPDLWVGVPAEMTANGTEVTSYSTDRWVAAVQLDFAARMEWTLTGNYHDGNHAPSVNIIGGTVVQAMAGTNVRLLSTTADPDNNQVATSWFQYSEEGTYNGTVTITQHGSSAVVQVPADAKPGQTISIILQGTDNGHFPLTRYDRVMVQVARPGGRWWGWR